MARYTHVSPAPQFALLVHQLRQQGRKKISPVSMQFRCAWHSPGSRQPPYFPTEPTGPWQTGTPFGCGKQCAAAPQPGPGFSGSHTTVDELVVVVVLLLVVVVVLLLVVVLLVVLLVVVEDEVVEEVEEVELEEEVVEELEEEEEVLPVVSPPAPLVVSCDVVAPPLPFGLPPWPVVDPSPPSPPSPDPAPAPAPLSESTAPFAQ